jgi:uncharacterized protein YsxB (DUF464 family)
MIRIDIYRDAAGAIAGFAVNGHANTAPHGQDIVCAGVAALAQSAALGLERHLGRDFDLDIGPGKLVLKLKGAPDGLTGAILETMLLGLTEIAGQSPQSVRITEHRR